MSISSGLTGWEQPNQQVSAYVKNISLCDALSSPLSMKMSAAEIVVSPNPAVDEFSFTPEEQVSSFTVIDNAMEHLPEKRYVSDRIFSPVSIL